MSVHRSNNYSSTSKSFHWLIAFLVIAMLFFGFFLDDIPKEFKPLAYMIHKSIGLTILALMIIRFVWIQFSGKPNLPSSVPVWQKVLSRLVHYSLYILLLIMPLSGWIMSTAAKKDPVYFGLITLKIPGISPDKALAKQMAELHTIFAWVIIFMVTVHILAALKHHFIDKDDVLKRMLPGK